MDLANLPGVPAWVSFLLVLGAGVTGAFIFWTKAARQNRQEESASEERIKTLLKEEVAGLNTKITNMKATIETQAGEIDTLKKSMIELQKTNEILTKVFQGRDDDAVQYRQEGRITMQLVAELAPLIKETNGNGKEILKHIAALYKSLDKHFENIEKMEKLTTTEKVTTVEHKKP